jgi:hypothetical protein
LVLPFADGMSTDALHRLISPEVLSCGSALRRDLPPIETDAEMCGVLGRTSRCGVAWCGGRCLFHGVVKKNETTFFLLFLAFFSLSLFLTVFFTQKTAE